MLIINGVKTEPKKDITIKKINNANEKIMVSSLLNIFFRTLFNSSNIYVISFIFELNLMQKCQIINKFASIMRYINLKRLFMLALMCLKHFIYR
jgi:hypothetical protein